MLAQATHQQCSVWRRTTLLWKETGWGEEVSAKFSSALSSHNTAAKFKWNHFQSHQATWIWSTVQTYFCSPGDHTSLQNIPWLQGLLGTPAITAWKRPEKCMEVANGVNPTFPGRAGICMLSNYCITQDNVIPPVQIRAELKTKLFSKRPNFTNTFFFSWKKANAFPFLRQERRT